MNYYNEFDKKAAAWIRELINMGLIPNGEVDERNIIDVQASDLKGFNQHHFFAGIAGWPYALQLAGVPDDYPIWTASLPCQPFSTAGKQLGKSDERHLLPHFLQLVRQCKPKLVIGEQVPGAIKHGWLDDLHTEMEREDYTVGATVLTAAGAGAFHIRQRLFWVAVRRLSDTNSYHHNQIEKITTEKDRKKIRDRKNKLRTRESIRTGNDVYGGMGDTNMQYTSEVKEVSERARDEFERIHEWSNSEWLKCWDNKHRPIKPVIKPLVDGLPKGMVHSRDTSEPFDADNTQEARLMRLKGYGNALVPQCAAVFIKATFEALGLYK